MLEREVYFSKFLLSTAQERKSAETQHKTRIKHTKQHKRILMRGILYIYKNIYTHTHTDICVCVIYFYFICMLNRLTRDESQ